MTKEDKQLLLRDLCARLPHGIKLDFYAKATDEHYVCTLLGIEPDGDRPIIARTDKGAFTFLAEHVKPYLRPMSSMTEEEKIKYLDLLKKYQFSDSHDDYVIYDWLNKKMFDYRGLIGKGGAIKVTEENNPYKD